MGLDMYLYAETYKCPSLESKEEAEVFNRVINALNADKIIEAEFPSAEIKLKVGYWRKANAIHAWFVDNVQRKRDNCKEFTVSREKAIELMETCQKVMLDPSSAERYLPTRSGFFFGSTDYDEYYYAQVEQTYFLLEKLLKSESALDDTWELKYQSSW